MNNNDNNIVTLNSNKISFNLKELLIQYKKFKKVYTNLLKEENFFESAIEYLDFSKTYSNDYFYDLNYYTSNKYESIIIFLCYFSHKDFDEKKYEHLKNLLYFSNENLHNFIKIILKCVDEEYKKNKYFLELKKIIKTFFSNQINKNKVFSIQLSNNLILNSIKNFIFLYIKSSDEKIFSFLSENIKNQSKISPSTLKKLKETLNSTKNEIEQNEFILKNTYHHINLDGPFLPPISNKYEYTLVLDLDETIVHNNSTEKIEPILRPGIEEFLNVLSNYYEIILFTASTKEYANTVLNYIKNSNLINYKLFRENTTKFSDNYLKDIGKLGRDLKKIIIIDNVSDNFCLNPENGIFINTWIGDENDKSLYELIPVLKSIVTNKQKDVRKTLRKMRDSLIRFYINGDQKPFQTLIKNCNNLN